MKLREVKIKNFRCLVDVSIPIGDTTVLVGENNTGKTALLDALRIILTRGSTGRGIPFDEYDYHMAKKGDSPQTSEGIIIELWFREDAPDEWPDSLIQAISDIIQTDPTRDLDAIGLRLSCKYDSMSKQLVPKWEFLALDGQPLGGKGASPANLTKFLYYIRLFYLSALRDSDSEFSPRSQFWGKILRDLKIGEEQRKTLSEELSKLNEALLNADPRLNQVKTSLENIQKIVSGNGAQKTDIQALPLKPWELMSKSEVVIRGRGGEVDFPLSRHGQGIQSLSVLFLFQAYIDVLLKPTFQAETEAILAFEEPEAHLHPQATRALALSLGEIKSQKIISSHSPYFIQEIPLPQVRMFRRKGASSKVLWIKSNFETTVPNATALMQFCSDNATKYKYVEYTSTLTVNGRIEENEYRKLLSIYPKQNDVHSMLKRLYIESKLYLDSEELDALETYAKRIRGEVFFARAWLLCEGQTEYLLFRYFAELIGKPLDRYGVTVIDFQNNGSPGAFVALAETYKIPWLMVCDNDAEKPKFIKQIEDRGLDKKEIDILVRPLSEKDVELFLIRNGFIKEYLQLLSERKVKLVKKSGEAGVEEEIATIIRKDKTDYILDLIRLLQAIKIDKARVPAFFQTIINDIVARAV
jgi:putative ATP-dependent endonuclease of OLD family